MATSIHFKDGTYDNFTLLGDRINSRRATWEGPPPTHGETSYVPGYWEWLEDILKHNKDVLDMARLYNAVHASLFTYDIDRNILQAFLELWCPTTNSLHTSIGELSITLWDMRYTGGLPIRGSFYDEVIPSDRELTVRDKDNQLFLPPCCKYLFQAYYYIYHSNSSRVTTFDWVRFWFKGDIRYERPPARTTKKHSSKPRKSNNPSGIIGDPIPHSAAQDKVFKDIGVEDDVVEETFLAAFLACWLCKFVLPADEVDIVRPGVFKVASLMARGERFSLAVPVLSNIYRGLINISSSSSPSRCGVVLPTHYVYGWLGQYFDTYLPSNSSISGAKMVRIAGERNAKYFDRQEALFHLKNVMLPKLISFSLCKEKQECLMDTGKQASILSEYLISICSSYLTFRKNNELIVESYSPYRCARQFNFCQDIPGKLKKNIHSCQLDEIVQLWQSCMRIGTGAKLEIPISPSDVMMTKDYADWWKKYASDFIATDNNVAKATKDPESKEVSKKRLHSSIKDANKLPSKPASAVKVKVVIPPLAPKVTFKNSNTEQQALENEQASSEESDSNGRDKNPKRMKRKHESSLEDLVANNARDNIDFQRATSTHPVEENHSSSSSSVHSPCSLDLLLQSCKEISPNKPPVTLPTQGVFGAGNNLMTEVEPSTLHADQLIDNCTKDFVTKLWGGIKGKIAKDPLHLLSPLKIEATKILDRITSVGAPNILPLQQLVDKFFQSIESYELICDGDAEASDEPTSEIINEANLLLVAAERDQARRTKTVEDLIAKLNDIDTQVMEVRSRLSDLLAQKKNAEELLSQEGWKLSETQGELLSIQEAISSFDATPCSSTDKVKLKDMELSLEHLRDELINFRLFP